MSVYCRLQQIHDGQCDARPGQEDSTKGLCVEREEESRGIEIFCLCSTSKGVKDKIVMVHVSQVKVDGRLKKHTEPPAAPESKELFQVDEVESRKMDELETAAKITDTETDTDNSFYVIATGTNSLSLGGKYFLSTFREGL